MFIFKMTPIIFIVIGVTLNDQHREEYHQTQHSSPSAFQHVPADWFGFRAIKLLYYTPNTAQSLRLACRQPRFCSSGGQKHDFR